MLNSIYKSTYKTALIVEFAQCEWHTKKLEKLSLHLKKLEKCYMFSQEQVIVITSVFSVPFPSLPDHVVPLSAVRRMDIYDEQTTTMRVRWEEALGATGYMLLYSAINATHPTAEQEVRYIIATLREKTV